MAVAITLKHLGAHFKKSGQADKAVNVLQRALAIEEKALGPDDVVVATTLQALGVIYLNEGRYVEGEPLLLRALSIQEHVLGALHPRVATTLEACARLLRETGRLDAAVQAEAGIQRIHTAGKR